jgi:hypothetical protein
MFQYAAGFNLAKKNNAQLLLDTTFLNDRFPRKEFTYRTFDLDVFTLELHFTLFSKISHVVPVPGFWLGLDLICMKVCDIFGMRRIINEKYLDSSKSPMEGDIVLYGRWQNEKYFIDFADDIRNMFRFGQELSGAAAAFARQIKNSNSVSIHVRRGDYVNFKSMKKIVGDTDISYYVRAVSYIGERVQKPQFFVFSDDVAWCRENIKIPFPVIYLDEKTAGPKSAFHLELMSLCKHNIIANSTFSWWGAWLNENPEKIIIAPVDWSKDGKNSNIVPLDWIRF